MIVNLLNPKHLNGHYVDDVRVLSIVDDLQLQRIYVDTFELGIIIMWEGQEYQELKHYSRIDIKKKIENL